MNTYLIENLPALEAITEKAQTLEDLGYHYSNLDQEIKELTKIKEGLKTRILEKFEVEFGHEGHSIVNEQTGNTIQRVLSVLQNIDEGKLKKLIKPEIWNKITLDKVSMELFLALIKTGDINPRLIADAVENKEVEKLVVRRAK